MITSRTFPSIFEDIPCLRPHAAKITEYMGERRTERNIRLIRSRFDDFARWAREMEREAELKENPRTILQIPVEPQDLAAYAEWLDEERGLALSSISSYVSAIGALHIAAGFLNPTGSAEVKGVLNKLRDEYPEPRSHRARALSDAELESIFNVLYIPRIARGRRRERREEARKRANVDKALLLSMIGAGMRGSEAAELTWDRVRGEDDFPGTIFLPVNWGRRKGEWVPIDEECLQALMAIKPEGADRNSRVFNLSGSQVNRRLKRMCEEAGIDSKGISGYTPRATLHRLMLESAVSIELLRFQLRLKPPQSVYPVPERIHAHHWRVWRAQALKVLGFAPPDDIRDKHSQDDLFNARALSDVELNSILATLPGRRRTRENNMESVEGARKRASVDRALLLSMIGAGMRGSEAAELMWGNVMMKDLLVPGNIFLPDNREREKGIGVWIPIDEECLQALKAIRPEGPDLHSRVFNLSGSQVNRRLKRMCEEAGIDSKDISGYTPRATLYRLLLESAAPIELVRCQLRLKSPQSVYRISEFVHARYWSVWRGQDFKVLMFDPTTAIPDKHTSLEPDEVDIKAPATELNDDKGPDTRQPDSQVASRDFVASTRLSDC